MENKRGRKNKSVAKRAQHPKNLHVHVEVTVMKKKTCCTVIDPL